MYILQGQNRLWRRASLSIGAPLGNPEEGSSTGDFERRMKGALGSELLSLRRPRKRDLGEGATSLGTLEDTLRKSSDTGISIYRGPFITEGNLVSGGRLVHRGL